MTSTEAWNKLKRDIRLLIADYLIGFASIVAPDDSEEKKILARFSIKYSNKYTLKTLDGMKSKD